MKILVTGHKGYIGSHLVSILKENGFKAINMLGGIKAWNDLPQMKKE